MKVLMIGAYPLHSGVVNGGIEAVTSALVPALAARDDIDNVTVLRFHNGEVPTHHHHAGPKVDVYYVRGQARLRRLTGSCLDVLKARRLAARLRPDVVHGQEIGLYGDVATRCSPNSIVTVHGLAHIEMKMSARRAVSDRLRVRMTEGLVRRVLRRAKVVISISDYDSRELRHFVQGSRVAIANPIRPEFFSLAPSAPTPPRLLFAGVLSERKNVLGLLRAFARARTGLDDARLVIVGPQPDEAYVLAVQRAVAELGLDSHVDILGLVDDERLLSEISAARAVALFSREETAPTIIAQAMAAGKPVVASRVGGVAEMVVDSETGFVVDSGDEAALADRIRILLQDQALCLRLGRRAHTLAAGRYAPDAVAAKTVEAYRKVGELR
jgi:glycosyltransferase involved in cell wall biosynthesis